MAKSIVFFALKGGVGKSTTAINVSGVLSTYKKQRVLIIDLDGQSNASLAFGINAEDERSGGKFSIGELLYGVAKVLSLGKYESNASALRNKILSSIVKTSSGVDLLYSSKDVRFQFSLIEELEIDKDKVMPYLLSNLMTLIDDCYDYIIIDSVPQTGLQLDVALAGASHAVSVSNLDGFSFNALGDSLKYLKTSILQKLDADVTFLGFVLNEVNLHQTHQNAVYEGIMDYQDTYRIKVFDTTIPDFVKIASSSLSGIIASLVETKDYEKAREAYNRLTDEILTEMEKQ
jgi:chromosome partitioning protein